MNIPREVVLTEIWLDEQARLAEGSFPPLPAKVWVSEIAKAAVWLIGLVLFLLVLCILAPEGRADAVKPSQVEHYLELNTALPLGIGIGGELAENLLDAQLLAWGDRWQKGSLRASEDAVLKAITLYVWPNGPEVVTDEDGFPIVWAQSRVAIDLRLSAGFDTTTFDFGERPVVTAEPDVLLLLLIGLVAALPIPMLVRDGIRKSVGKMIVAMVRAHRTVTS
jgi:hypothetical protein